MNKEKIIQKVLKFFAKRILRKYKPRVIGITGSVGKSTVKDMIFLVLKNAGFDVRKSEKNYNNEVGIPLSIIGVSGEKKNLTQWFEVLVEAIKLVIFTQKYPNILILELAVDYPGDMKYFCDFIPIEVGVLTNVGISHLENFKTKEKLFVEKKYLLDMSTNAVVYNQEDIGDKIKDDIAAKKSFTYGFEKGDFQILEMKYNYDEKNILIGMSFKIKNKEKIIHGQLNNLIGKPYLYGVLGAISVAKYFKIDLRDSVNALIDVTVIPGRMALLRGIKKTTLLDDTYNSAPASVAEALNVVEKVKAERKLIVLGDMLELGRKEVASHQSVGQRLAKMNDVIFIAVGKRMKTAVESFKETRKKSGLEVFNDNNQKVYWLENSIEAGKVVKDLMAEGDFVLVKGSQGMRMEKIVAEIMAEPNKKKELLVRQNKDWVN